ncbi:MAG: hypothetical protein H9W81_13765 [Enterococcus sp.]|nr:hypothetical protein [Enterococcus sp.]
MAEEINEPAYKAQLKKDTLQLLIRKGIPVSKVESIYGWLDANAMSHIRNTDCVWTFPEEDVALEESEVETFGDTFNGNRIDTVTTAYFASCTCGAFPEVPLRLETTLSDLLIDLFKWS